MPRESRTITRSRGWIRSESRDEHRSVGTGKAEAPGGVDAERFEQLGGEHFADPALQREPAVAHAGARGLTAALGSEVQQATVHAIEELREQESPAVSEVRVVALELMTVVTQRQRLREIRGQRAKATEVVDPLGVRKLRQADPARCALVAKAEPVLGEARGVHEIEESVAEAAKARVGTIFGSKGHRRSGRV